MKFRKFFVLFLVVLLSLTLFACGGDEIPDPTDPTVEVDQFTITFNSNGGTSITAIKRDTGSLVAKPVDPTKADSVFDGWYTEAAFSNPVTWPITLNANLTVYAKWVTSTDYFLLARDATIDVNQFEYDFNLSVDIAYGVIDGPSAIIDGNVKYNSSAQNSYYKFEQNSGLLLSDGSVHTIKTGNDLSVFKVKPDGKLYAYEKETVASDFKYESSSFAKVLFQYESDQIESVTRAANGKYQIEYNGSATGIVNSAIGFLDNPILQQFVNLPNSDSSLLTYVTFENDKIKTFEYQFSIVVAGASLTFHYDLTFANSGNAVVISVPTFAGISITTTDINSKLILINNALNSYKALGNSGYTYDVRTEVDFPGANSIGAHVQGRTMRQVVGSDVFYWNRIELDSDYKNSNLFDDQGIIDYERYRVVYANSDFYDVIDGVFSNTYTKIEGYNNSNIDEFYFMLPTSMLNASNVSLIQQTTNGTTMTYSIGLNVEGILDLLQFIDASIRVDVNEQNEVVIYDIASGLEIKACDLDITIDNGNLVSIQVELKGAYVANAYTGTEFSGPCSFELILDLIVNNLGNSYTPPTSNSQVDLSNS